MSKVIVIGSQKGGVGKTTTTLNLAYSLCSMGKKVLAIDFDSQANLSTCYGIENFVYGYSVGLGNDEGNAVLRRASVDALGGPYIRIAPTCVYSCDYLCRIRNL